MYEYACILSGYLTFDEFQKLMEKIDLGTRGRPTCHSGIYMHIHIRAHTYTCTYIRTYTYTHTYAHLKVGLSTTSHAGKWSTGIHSYFHPSQYPIGITSQELRFVISEADENDNGVVDYNEFVPLAVDMIQVRQHTYPMIALCHYKTIPDG